VLRVKRDILRRSSIGLLDDRAKDPSAKRAAARHTPRTAVDRQHVRILPENLSTSIQLLGAHRRHPPAARLRPVAAITPATARSWISNGDRYGLQVERLSVWRRLRAGRRITCGALGTCARATYGEVALLAAPDAATAGPSASTQSATGSVGRLRRERRQGRLETREQSQQGEFGIDFRDADRLDRDLHAPPTSFSCRPPFRLAAASRIPVAGYYSFDGELAIQPCEPQRIAGNFALETGRLL
jgi:hypothetical protein